MGEKEVKHTTLTAEEANGTRVELVHTDDLQPPFSPQDYEDKDRRITLALGDQGKVTAIGWSSDGLTITNLFVTWDSGERSCLHPGKGDMVKVLSSEDL